MNNWIIVSYYTPNYKTIAEEYLIPSLNKLNLDSYIIEIPNLNGWKEATDYKPIFIKDCLNKFKTNLVFIDVDATINEYPILFDNIPQEFDIGVHYFDPKIHYNNSHSPIHIASGTLFIRNNENVFKLIDEWIKLTPITRWEQTALQLAIEHNPTIKVYNLPREYCYITTQPNRQPPKIIIETPIISHYQISRKIRRKYG